MLAPKSARAKQISNSEKSQGIRNLPVSSVLGSSVSVVSSVGSCSSTPGGGI
nr:hypothetical protein [Tanacetum cinerariifolium]